MSGHGIKTHIGIILTIFVISVALTLLADEEVRVRQAAGELLGAFCQKFGPRVYEQCQAHVFDLIKTNLDRSDVTEQHQQQEKVTLFNFTDVFSHKLLSII